MLTLRWVSHLRRMMRSTSSVSWWRNWSSRCWTRMRSEHIFRYYILRDKHQHFSPDSPSWSPPSACSCWPLPGEMETRSRLNSAGCRWRVTVPRLRWRRCCRLWRSWPSTMTRRARRWRRKACRISSWLISCPRKWCVITGMAWKWDRNKLEHGRRWNRWRAQ